MFSKSSKQHFFILILLILGMAAGSFAPISASARKDDEKAKKDKDKKDKGDKSKDKADKDPAADRDARPILWRDPTDIESRDLFHGQGGAAGAPDPNGK